MYPSIAIYNVVLGGECRTCRGEAVFREWRMPDEFGDPGKLVRSEFLYTTIDGRKYFEYEPIIHGARLSIRSQQMAKQPIWEVEE